MFGWVNSVGVCDSLVVLILLFGGLWVVWLFYFLVFLWFYLLSVALGVCLVCLCLQWELPVGGCVGRLLFWVCIVSGGLLLCFLLRFGVDCCLNCLCRRFWGVRSGWFR